MQNWYQSISAESWIKIWLPFTSSYCRIVVCLAELPGDWFYCISIFDLDNNLFQVNLVPTTVLSDFVNSLGRANNHEISDDIIHLFHTFLKLKKIHWIMIIYMDIEADCWMTGQCWMTMSPNNIRLEVKTLISFIGCHPTLSVYKLKLWIHFRCCHPTILPCTNLPLTPPNIHFLCFII